jgi:hypothetical protein
MATGFGAKQAEQLGYILDLMPDLNVYAAKFSFKLPGEEDAMTYLLASSVPWPTPRSGKPKN